MEINFVSDNKDNENNQRSPECDQDSNNKAEEIHTSDMVFNF